jgi:hypothetical protein
MTTRLGTPFRPPEFIETMADAELVIQQLRADLETLRTQVTAAATGAPSSPVSYNANPFSGNIKPGSSSGLKLFQAAEREKLVAKIASNIQFIEALRDDSAAFAWSILIGVIGPSNYHILQDFKALAWLQSSLIGQQPQQYFQLQGNHYQKHLQLILPTMQLIKLSSINVSVLT